MEFLFAIAAGAFIVWCLASIPYIRRIEKHLSEISQGLKSLNVSLRYDHDVVVTPHYPSKDKTNG